MSAVRSEEACGRGGKCPWGRQGHASDWGDPLAPGFWHAKVPSFSLGTCGPGSLEPVLQKRSCLSPGFSVEHDQGLGSRVCYSKDLLASGRPRLIREAVRGRGKLPVCLQPLCPMKQAATGAGRAGGEWPAWQAVVGGDPAELLPGSGGTRDLSGVGTEWFRHAQAAPVSASSLWRPTCSSASAWWRPSAAPSWTASSLLGTS